MLRLAVMLAFAVLSLGFAPAPFPKAERPTRETQQQRAIAECIRRLEELGVRWELSLDNGRGRVDFGVRGRGLAGASWFRDGDLLGTLRDIVKIVEAYDKRK